MALIINGEKIEDSAIQKEVERLRPDYERVFADQSPQEREAQLFKWSKENLIERTLIRQEAQKSGDRISKDKLESILARMKESYKNQEEFYKELNVNNDQEAKQTIELMALVHDFFEGICKKLPKPSKDDVLKYYQENKEQFKFEEQVRVAHIVKHIDGQTDEATAYNIIMKAQDELKNGAAFETLVEKYSDCPENGGDLGYITRGEMVEEFDDVVFNLGVGQISDVFRTRFGFHIAKVYVRQPAEIPALEEIKEQLVDELKKQMQEKAIDERIDQLKRKANIEEI